MVNREIMTRVRALMTLIAAVGLLVLTMVAGASTSENPNVTSDDGDACSTSNPNHQ
jgi:hypothetical protein